MLQGRYTPEFSFLVTCVSLGILPSSREVRMKRVIAVATGGLLLAFAQVTMAQKPEKEPEDLQKLLKERLAAARESYEAATARLDPEMSYVWSRRWMEAERDVARNKAERLAALQGHFERMKKLELIAIIAETKDSAPEVKNLAPSKFYRAEADIWLTQEKARQGAR
jgi:hypothetical protein